MKQKWKLTLGAVCALLLSSAVYAQKLPDGKGKQEMIQGCTDCHSAKLVVQKRRTPEDWKKVVEDMAARGSESTPQDIDNIIRYLSTNFGIEKGGAIPTTHASNPPASKATARH